MTSCHWSANSKAECFITSANIPRGPLGAGGARERDDSEVSPPSAPREGEELGLEEDPVVGRKGMHSQNKASFVQFSSLFYLVS